MRKILIVFILTGFLTLIYGCKPDTLVFSLSKYVVYFEKYKLRGESQSYFVEITLGERETLPFLKVMLLPKNLNSECNEVRFLYGNEANTLKKSQNFQSVFDIIDIKVHDFITVINDSGNEIIDLTSISPPPDKEELLEKASSRYAEKIAEHSINNSFMQKVYIKILADMNGIAYFYVGFRGNNDYYAVLIDPETGNIIVDHSS